MKIEMVNYEHAENGISLQICPETDVEEGLLRGLFQHGKAETGHPGNAKGNTGFYLNWKQPNEDAKP